MSDSDVGSSTEQIMDESDYFIRDPSGFASNMLDNLPLPSHLVLFDAQEVQLRDILALHGYTKVVYKMPLFDFTILICFYRHCLQVELDSELTRAIVHLQAQKYFHSHFRVDRELQGYVVVYVQHQTV